MHKDKTDQGVSDSIGNSFSMAEDGFIGNGFALSPKHGFELLLVSARSLTFVGMDISPFPDGGVTLA